MLKFPFSTRAELSQRKAITSIVGKTEIFPVTSLATANRMPRTLLISQEDGRASKTYGVKKVRTNMKFSFIISVVIVFLWGGIPAVDSRILNELKYLEYLNDLDRRNVELDDIHKQWPFHSVAKTVDEIEEGIIPGSNPINRDDLMQVVSIAREGMTDTHNQNYRGKLLDKLEDGFKHIRDLTDRADQLSQYRRYKPFDQEVLEEARMYPERNAEEEITFNEEDDNAYENPDINFEEKDEELTELKPSSLHRTFFPRIAPVEKPSNFESAFEDSGESGEDEEEEDEEIPNLKPTFPKAYFPRIAPVDIPVNYKIDDLEFSSDNNNHMHHEHEDYKFRDGEEFPHSISFDEIPVAENPGEFGLKPLDPRFYRDALQTEGTMTIEPKEAPVHSYHLETPLVSKPKMNSRNDVEQQLQSSPSNEENLDRSFESKDVEVVPFKPDSQEDTAGVYIIAIVAGISAAATVGLMAVGIGWYKCKSRRQRIPVDGCITE